MIESDKNRFYLGGFSEVIKDRQKYPSILSNPDNDFSKLNFSRLLEYDGNVVIAPAILNSRTGVDLNPYKNDIPNNFRNFLNLALLSVELALGKQLRTIFRGKRQKVPINFNLIVPHGACVIFMPTVLKYFTSVPNFLYFEEEFIAKRLRSNNCLVKYDKNLVVLNTMCSPSTSQQHLRKKIMRKWYGLVCLMLS